MLKGLFGMSTYWLYAPWGEQIWRDLLGCQDLSCPHQVKFVHPEERTTGRETCQTTLAMWNSSSWHQSTMLPKCFSDFCVAKIDMLYCKNRQFPLSANLETHTPPITIHLNSTHLYIRVMFLLKISATPTPALNHFVNNIIIYENQ